jgi:hypothetical protein
MLGPVIRTPLLDRMSIQLQFILGNTASWWYLFLYFQHYHVISILMYTCTINYNVNKWLQNVWQFSTVIINWYLKSNDLFYLKFYLICNITWWEHKKTLINRYYIMSLGNIICYIMVQGHSTSGSSVCKCVCVYICQSVGSGILYIKQLVIYMYTCI